MPIVELPASHRLALALRGALHDSDLERRGTRIVYFFDADVVAGCFYASSLVEDDSTQPAAFEGTLEPQSPLSRNIVKSLWLQNQLPSVRLTIPHLREFRGVLERLKESGGLHHHLGHMKVLISSRYGLQSGSPAAKRLRRLFMSLSIGNTHADDKTAMIVETLGMGEFAALEAELGPFCDWARRPFDRQLDLQGDLGETQDHIAQHDKRFSMIVASLESMRPNKRLSNNCADAASLLAIARLWARDYRASTEYRFYTHTDVLRTFCEHDPLGREVTSHPEQMPSLGAVLTNSPMCAIRTSSYFLLRTAFESLGFGTTPFTQSHISEREQLARAADSLLRADEAPGNMRLTSECIPSAALWRLLTGLRDRAFAYRMLTTHRERVLEVLRTLKPHIEGTGALLEQLEENDEVIRNSLLAAVEELSQTILGTVVQRTVQSHLISADLPSEAECEQAIRRWSVLFASENAIRAAVSRLIRLCRFNLHSDSGLKPPDMDILNSPESPEDAYELVIPLLILGDHDTVLAFLRRCPQPTELPKRAAFLALLTWGRSMQLTGRNNSVDQAWSEFITSVAALTVDDHSQLMWDVVVAWVAVYVSSFQRDNVSVSHSISETSRVLQLGLERADRAVHSSSLSRGLLEMVWAAKIVLLANSTWIGGQATDLVTALTECEQQITCEPGIYLKNARFWGQYAAWNRGGGDVQAIGWKLSYVQNVAFERFQCAARALMRSGAIDI